MADDNSKTIIRALLIAVAAVAVVACFAYVLWRSEEPESVLVPAPAANESVPVASRDTPARPAARTVPRERRPAVRSGPGTIYGTVFRLDGSTAPAKVTVRPYSSPAQTAVTATAGAWDAVCDDSGAFEIRDLPHGGFVVSARHADGYAARRVRLQPREDRIELTLVLYPGQPVAGLVVNESGERVAGARLTPVLRDGDEAPAELAQSLSIVSDADGAFAFESLEPRAWQVYVAATGYAPVLTEPLAVGVTNHVVTVSAGAVVEGTVVDHADNAPLEGVPVTARIADLPVPPLRARSDEDGRFHLVIGDGRYTVDVESGDLIVVGGAVEVSPQGGHVPPVSLRVASGGTVRGRLIDGDSGEGIAGATLRARPKDRNARMKETTSGEDGQFEITGLAVGEYTIAPFALSGYSNEREHRKDAVVAVAPGETVEGIELMVYRGRYVSGVVVHPNGEPAPGAVVDVALPDRRMGTQINADNEGRFTYAGLTSEQRVQFSASTANARSALTEVVVPATGVSEVTLTLDIDAAAALGGQVVNQHGAPVQVDLSGEGTNNPLNRFMLVKTSTDGRFLVTGLAPDTYRVRARQNVSASKDIAVVTLAADQRLLNQRFVYAIDSGSIAGKVVDADGKPVSASLQLTRLTNDARYPGPMHSSGHDGTFDVQDIEEGQYEIQARAAGYDPQTVAAQTGDRNVLITLGKGLMLTGRVVDAATQQPITRFEIAASDARYTSAAIPGAAEFRAISDPEGRFSLPLESGDYRVAVRASGYQLARTLASLAADAPAEEIVVALQPGDVKVTGTVVDETGGSVAGAAVFIGPLPSRPEFVLDRAATRTDESGAYEVAGLAAGDIVVSAYHPVHGIGSASGTIDPSNSGPVTIALQPPSVVEGTTMLDGEPVAAMVRIETAMGRHLGGASDESGYFRVESVPSGAATLTAELLDAGGETIPPFVQELEVAPGETITVDVTFAR